MISVEKYSRGKANFEESPPDQISKSNQNQKIVNDVFS